MAPKIILQNDFRRQWEVVAEPVLGAVRRVGESGWYILGKEVEAFEIALAEMWGVGHAVGVGNGMDALEIGLRCLELKRGEKVLTTPLSAFATTLAIIRAGGVPVFVDVDELGQIDFQQCRAALLRDRSIRFLLPVHLYGFALDLLELRNLKQEFDLQIVEDCAQAIGALDHGIPAGAVGQVAATSFYPTKNLGALGDGGALLTNDPALAEKAKSLRNYGQSALYVHSKLGLNSRLDELQAAILRDAFLPNLEVWTKRRCEVAGAYRSAISHPSVKVLAPDFKAGAVWHLFPVMVVEGMRDNLREHLRSRNILTGIHYPHIIPDQAALDANGSSQSAFEPNQARHFAACELSLPVHPFLSEQEIQAVIQACNDWTP